MRLKNIEFYKWIVEGKDDLGNAVRKHQVVGTYKGKLTEWSLEEVALLDRAITKQQRKLLTVAPTDVLKASDLIVIDNEKYMITDKIKDYRRWRLVYVKRYAHD